MSEIIVSLLAESGEIVARFPVPVDGSPTFWTFADQPVILRRLSAQVTDPPPPDQAALIKELTEMLDTIREIVCEDDPDEDY